MQDDVFDFKRNFLNLKINPLRKSKNLKMLSMYLLKNNARILKKLSTYLTLMDQAQ